MLGPLLINDQKLYAKQDIGGLFKMNIVFCRLAKKRCFRVLKILNDDKQLNIRNFSSTHFRETR